jgi:type II secretory ATPase GspE/PulE/Tfp pilus assembly ATPase PilB-like protein
MSGAVTGAPKGRLGERLVAAGAISEAQLSLALKENRRTGGRLGETIISLGFCTEQELTGILASQAGVEQVDLTGLRVSDAVRALLEESFCRKHKLLPLELRDGTIRVAMSNSFDVMAVDAVSELTGLPVEVVAASEPAVLESLDRVYGDGGQSIERLVADAMRALEDRSGELTGLVSDQPVVKLVDAILREAVRCGATDVHIEPESRVLRTRLRVDGVLVSSHTLPIELRPAVAARIKLIADLDISETRLPHDGQFVATIDRRHINVRVSTLPTIHGENVVMRILDKSKLVLGLSDLGYSERNHQRFSEAIRRPSGIVLVTGPTGCGKTTSLYAALNEINTMDLKIATLEDPVEYELPVIRQSQVNVTAGFTFASGLRALLRQDPDVVLVGEMRDADTVEVALRAAMTGHLVLSTLHTNSALGSLPRLLNMGVESYLLAGTLAAVVAQRLVRKLCTVCAIPDTSPDPLECRVLGLEPDDPGLRVSPGCEACNGTGFRGRRAIAEVLTVTPRLGRALMSNADLATLERVVRQDGMVGIVEEAREMVRSGETSVSEALRHVWDVDLGAPLAAE